MDALHPSDPKLRWFWDQLDKYLARHSLKQTKPRHAIIQAFLGMGSHVDAEGLRARLVAMGHKAGLATIYRTLNLLREAGLVDQKVFADGRSVFELLHPDTHHDHIFCQRCGAIFEFEDDEIEKRQKEIAARMNFELLNHRLDLVGLCRLDPCPRSANT